MGQKSSWPHNLVIKTQREDVREPRFYVYMYMSVCIKIPKQDIKKKKKCSSMALSSSLPDHFVSLPQDRLWHSNSESLTVCSAGTWLITWTRGQLPRFCGWTGNTSGSMCIYPAARISARQEAEVAELVTFLCTQNFWAESQQACKAISCFQTERAVKASQPLCHQWLQQPISKRNNKTKTWL